MDPSDVNNSGRALQGALRRFADHIQPTVVCTGVRNAYILTYEVVPAELVSGDKYAFISGSDAAIFSNTGPTTLDVGVGGPVPIFLDGVALAGGEIVADHVMEVCYRDTPSVHWELLSTRASQSFSRLQPGASPAIYTSAPRLMLRANQTYFVNSVTGHDDNTGWGANGHEWRTLQFAYNFLCENVDGAGHVVTLDFTGVDNQGLVVDCPIVGTMNCTINLNGAINTLNPYGIAAFRPGVKLEIKGGGTIQAGVYGVVASENAFVGYQGVHFATCGVAHMYAQNDSSILIRNSYVVDAGAQFHWLSDTASSITILPGAGVALNPTAPPAFTGVFAQVSTNGIIDAALGGFSGTATGTKYFASTGGGIFLNGVVLPGSAAGSVDPTTYGWVKL